MQLPDFLRAINTVSPTLIRVEADELTYCLHVILRFELELALIEGTLDPGDLPQAWASKMRELLGIEVPDDLRGVLQDIHWSEGIIGYFPTYAIGNVLAAQLWEALRADLPGLDDDLRAGDPSALREWLREKIHRHGSRLMPAELIEQAVGGPLDPGPDAEAPRNEVSRAVRARSVAAVRTCDESHFRLPESPWLTAGGRRMLGPPRLEKDDLMPSAVRKASAVVAGASLLVLLALGGTAQAAKSTKTVNATSVLKSLVSQTQRLPSAAASRASKARLLRSARHARSVASRRPCSAVRDLSSYRKTLRSARIRGSAKGKRNRARLRARLAALGPASLKREPQAALRPPHEGLRRRRHPVDPACAPRRPSSPATPTG